MSPCVRCSVAPAHQRRTDAGNGTRYPIPEPMQSAKRALFFCFHLYWIPKFKFHFSAAAGCWLACWLAAACMGQACLLVRGLSTSSSTRACLPYQLQQQQYCSSIVDSNHDQRIIPQSFYTIQQYHIPGTRNTAVITGRIDLPRRGLSSFIRRTAVRTSALRKQSWNFLEFSR